MIAVLDWELCSIGHPFADLAYLGMPYHLADEIVGACDAFVYLRPATAGIRGLGAPAPGVGRVDSIAPSIRNAGIPGESDVVRAYCKRRGLAYPVPDWNYYLALAFFRMASIAQVRHWFGGWEFNAAGRVCALDSGQRQRDQCRPVLQGYYNKEMTSSHARQAAIAVAELGWSVSQQRSILPAGPSDVMVAAAFPSARASKLLVISRKIANQH